MLRPERDRRGKRQRAWKIFEDLRLVDASNFVAPGDDALLAILPSQFAPRVHLFRLDVFQALVVRAEVCDRVGLCSAAL
jgi:hypothetical protein